MPTSAVSALQAVCSMPPRARRSSTSARGLTRHGRPSRPGSAAVTGLRALAVGSNVAVFATAVLARGYPVEQELATLDIVRQLLDS